MARTIGFVLRDDRTFSSGNGVTLLMTTTEADRGSFGYCGKESRTTEWVRFDEDDDRGCVRTPAKMEITKHMEEWRGFGDSYFGPRITRFDRGCVDGKAGPYGPGIPNSQSEMGWAIQILEKQNTASFPVPLRYLDTCERKKKVSGVGPVK